MLVSLMITMQQNAVVAVSGVLESQNDRDKHLVSVLQMCNSPGDVQSENYKVKL